MKVTRKKSYNVSTFLGRGCRPLPFTTYSAGLTPANRRAPNAQPAARAGQWGPPRPCPTWPPGPPLVPPPDQWPRGARRGRGWRRGGRPPRPRPRRGPFIRPRARNKGRAAREGAGRGQCAAPRGGRHCTHTRSGQKPRGLPPRPSGKPLRAEAQGNPRASWPDPGLAAHSRVVPAGAPTPGRKVPARGGAEGEACISVTWPVLGGPSRAGATSRPAPGPRAGPASRVAPARAVT